MAKKNPFKKNKNEIIWNVVNSVIAGGLVFLGSFSDGEITRTGIFLSIVAAGVVILTKFKDYWSKEEREYAKVFNFVH